MAAHAAGTVKIANGLQFPAAHTKNLAPLNMLDFQSLPRPRGKELDARNEAGDTPLSRPIASLSHTEVTAGAPPATFRRETMILLTI